MHDLDTETDVLFNETADEAVALANTVAESHPDGELADIADGLLAGAVHYWLFSRKPCGKRDCENCAPIATAERRLRRLLAEVEESARMSDLYHQPEDANAGTA